MVEDKEEKSRGYGIDRPALELEGFEGQLEKAVWIGRVSSKVQRVVWLRSGIEVAD